MEVVGAIVDFLTVVDLFGGVSNVIGLNLEGFHKSLADCMQLADADAKATCEKTEEGWILTHPQISAEAGNR